MRGSNICCTLDDVMSRKIRVDNEVVGVLDHALIEGLAFQHGCGWEEFLSLALPFFIATNEADLLVGEE